MLISNERGAGQIVSTSDETRFYDDIGCLATDWAGRSAQASRSEVSRSGGARAFVRVDGEWLDAQTLSFARPAGAHTAMGSGVVAFRTPEAAARADREGRALTFNDITRNAAGE